LLAICTSCTGFAAGVAEAGTVSSVAGTAGEGGFVELAATGLPDVAGDEDAAVDTAADTMLIAGTCGEAGAGPAFCTTATVIAFCCDSPCASQPELFDNVLLADGLFAGELANEASGGEFLPLGDCAATVEDESFALVVQCAVGETGDEKVTAVETLGAAATKKNPSKAGSLTKAASIDSESGGIGMGSEEYVAARVFAECNTFPVLLSACTITGGNAKFFCPADDF
jgi:hypothetical protein